MARKAQQVHVADFQQMRIRRAVRCMARLATFNFYRLMLEHKWPAFFRVTGEAHRVLRRGGPYLLGLNRAMRIVAVIARNQAFVHPMMEGHRELRFLLGVARIAEFRLFFHQQEIRIFAVVGRMAVQAAHVVLVVD